MIVQEIIQFCHDKPKNYCAISKHQAGITFYISFAGLFDNNGSITHHEYQII